MQAGPASGKMVAGKWTAVEQAVSGSLKLAVALAAVLAGLAELAGLEPLVWNLHY